MQYEATTPNEYFELLENDWRKEKLLAIRRMILKYAPELTEGIKYKMLCYGKDSNPLFCLNAQKAYVSLYVGDIDKIEDFKALLKGFDLGKGCIRVKKSNAVDKSLEEFIKNTIEIWRSGGDTHF